MNEGAQTVALIIAVFGLVAWIAKLVIPYLLKKLDQRDMEIRELTENFRETINHKQTEFTAAINTLSESVKSYSTAVDAQAEIFKALVSKTKRKR